MNSVTFPPTVSDTMPHSVAVSCEVSSNSSVDIVGKLNSMIKMSEEPSLGKRPKNIRRRSSLEQIMYICNRGYQAFPLVFLRVHDFQTTLGMDFRKIIPMVKAMFVLRLGVYVSVGFLSLEALCCLMFFLRLPMLYSSFFLIGCIALLSLLALQIFDVGFVLRRKLMSSFFFKKKIDSIH